MGSTAPQENSGPDQTRKTAETRSAILAAARDVALRDGVLEMSLARVAEDAGCAPNAVYELFSSKDDLLLAVIASDLATLAQVMRNSVSGQDGQPNVQASGEAEQGTDEAPDAESHLISRFPVVQSRRDQSRALEAAQAAEAAQKESTETKEAIAKLQESVSRLEARPVDSWLERRLREFERGLDALQAHHAKQGNAENSAEERFQKLHEGIRELEQRQFAAAEDAVRSVMQRLEATEKRLLELVSNVEADTSGHSRRLTALENAAPATVEVALPQPVAMPQPEITKAEEVKPAPGAESSMLSGGATYLAAARRSAQAAAVAAESAAPRKVKKKTNPTMVYMTFGSLFLFVALIIGMGLVLRNGEMAKPAMHPVLQAQQAIVPRHPMAMVPAHPKFDDRQKRLSELAQAGNPAAELLVGLEYLDGKLLPENQSAAFSWLTRAASKGQPVAQYSLGEMWSAGPHSDPVQAFQWFGSAALRGNRRAMHSLAVSYAQGLGTTKNLTEAAHWFERAAVLGSVNSQFDLALLYERGMGVTQNLSTAYKWYAIAAAQGDKESQARVAALSSALTPTDLESAKVAALSFRPEPMDESANVAPNLSALP